MTSPTRSSFRSIKDELARRIGERVWQPGSLIPGEETLAREFGAARATVNRALQELAQAGLVERKRKAGTRVAANPVRQARFSIPVVGDEIAALGKSSRYQLLSRQVRHAQKAEATRMGINPGEKLLHIACLHYADDVPYQYEDRLINLATVPRAEHEGFESVGPNEWLVNEAPFSRADFTFLAAAASEKEARLLNIAPGQPVFVGERLTWLLAKPITYVRMVHPPSHRLHTKL
ncbi:UTRA domain-containing protein [Aureimonas fodinaquatilis]|uniref:UTRA domain-containing protein n=1 Tax=Aureimonas fodinaquatilis TaxID=2565783 RepID=A0A5B0DRH3_9HYPH|nr:GntR family transcriptional regulator [Aureimonas fodinaquatilis]KAA0969397.1 UTRA domain-containing protein [Aureimonas fodinaquatilis]